VYYGKKLIVSGGVPVVTDRLGSVRADTQGEQFAYYPFGEERTGTPDGRPKFGTYFRDMIGQDYADQRYYGSGTGRFLTVDPGGIKTANPSSPLSWNRYAYVQADPVNFLDPGGTDLVVAGTVCIGYEMIYCTIGYTSSGPATPENLDTAPEGGGGGGGGSATPQKPKICDSKILGPSITSIFSQMGKDLNVNPVFIMAVAVQESGWNLQHVYETNSTSNGQPLNNLFGMTDAGGNNLAYSSVQASATAWEQDWGPYLSNSPQTIQAFVADLLSNPSHMYNSGANWPVSIGGGTYPIPIKQAHGPDITKTIGTYKSALNALNECGIKLN
jgi:RHS repeat-associated protein